ncbi:MAG: DNA-3-methyladenine glycosylase I [Patescibacteria group bacterium]|jgi:DNA-3-methyladenine glycosylase I
MVDRCPWPTKNPLMVKYHDTEWGVPLHDDQKLFEFLTLEGAQAGLSWETILNRREGYRNAFCDFDYTKVATFTDNDVERLMQDVGIIRNRLKIKSVITNAQRFMEVIEEFGSFDSYIWGFTDGKTIKNKLQTRDDYQATSSESDAMAKDLKKRGFKFIGSTICYAHMQATGMVNDHAVYCFRYNEV